MSQMTKKALAASLKKMLENKPLSKITVTDIAADCGINRHTFYYHFRDIYDLVEWIYSSEAEKMAEMENIYDTWQQRAQEILRYTFQYALDNKKFIQGTYRSISRDELIKFMHQKVYGVVKSVVEDQAKNLCISAEKKKFVINFYTYAFQGIILSWIEDDMEKDPEGIIQMLFTMTQGELMQSLERFSEN